MSIAAEKTEGIVIRLADFSESSRVVTLLTREYGKVCALAKGAKRLKGPFESGLDLLARCRVVFRLKSGGLDLLTEAQLISSFNLSSHQLVPLYCGYYVAELLDGLTLEHDPHPNLYDETVRTLEDFQREADPRWPLFRFQLVLLRELGQLPDMQRCLQCDAPLAASPGAKYWVSAGGLLCPRCGKPEYDSGELKSTSLNCLQRLLDDTPGSTSSLSPTPDELREMHRFLVSAVSHILERRPKMLRYLPF